ncbi:MAG: peptidase U62, partial [Edaphobacter sp.]
MNRQRAVVAGAGWAGLMLVGMTWPQWTVAAAEAQAEPGQVSTVLVETMGSELHRAMNSLGSTGNAAQEPKPYFMSYAVADGEQIRITAQFGAITGSNESHRRFADVQIRIGTPAEDNTHGDHRNSALTTIPLPLTGDRAAIARSLWFATNRDYGKALDGYLKVKTEQEVRAKEEDRSADFSTEEPKVALLPAAPKLAVDRTAWEARLRELSGLFKQYPD